jgi:hypothetical protein
MTRTVEKSELRKSLFTFICLRHGLSAFDNLSTECKMDNQTLCDTACQEAKTIARARLEKSGIKVMMIHLHRVKFTILPRREKNSKRFASPGSRIRYILRKSHYSTSAFSSRTKLRCRVGNFKGQMGFGHLQAIFGAKWIPPC